MSPFNRFVSGLRALLRKNRTERDLDEEQRAYLDMAIEQKISSGLPRDAATRAARAEFGSVEAVKERVRDVGWEAHIDSLVQDVRFGVRSFFRTPSFTIPALLTLALGIGATAAMFSVIRTVMLEPLPYREPDRIVAVWETTRGGLTRNSIAPANFVASRERARALEYLAMVGPRSVAMTLNGEPLQIAGLTASSEVFRALDVGPALGRAYTAAEDGSTGVIVLSHEFWQRALGGRLDVLDLALTTDGERRTVIGVMPPRFTIAGQHADFLMPYDLTTEQLRAARGRGSSYAIARLRDGVSFNDADTEMRAIYAALEREEPERNAARTVMLFRLQDQMVGDMRPALLTLMGAVALVLVVGCVNVANLLLARSASRTREVGMRAALGARQGRLVRQMLTESLVLAAAGGIAGIGVAMLLHRGLLAVVSDRIPIPRLDQVTLDLSIVVLALIVALATGVVFGLVPALISAASGSGALREGGRQVGGRRLHRVLNSLVVAEVAMSLILLVGAGLLMRSFVNQRSIDTGYRPDGVLTARVRFPATRSDSSRTTAVYGESLARMSALPGVQQAAAATCLPPPSPCTATSIWRLDQPAPADGQRRSAQIRPVSPGFFKTMGIPHPSGRDFAASDTADSTPVALVSESVVRDHFDGQSPLDHRLHINTVAHANGREDMEWTIIGVVRDIRSSVDATAGPIVYVPFAQMPGRDMRFFLRTDRDPMLLATTVTRVVQSLDPEAPVDVRTLDDIVAGTIARPRAMTVLVGAFALLALALAAIGVYGVIAYSVRERRPEIGLRVALGATAIAVGRLVLGHALRLVAIGVAIGLIAAGALTRLLERLLFDVEPLDAWTFAVAPMVLVIVAAIASYVPARRGMYTPPADVLRAN
jgi:putative ABC transport system permease protein